MNYMLTQEWAEFLEDGVAMTLCCCGPDLRFKGARIIGAVVGLDRKTITFYFEKETALRVLPLLIETKKAAIIASLPSTYKTLQLKGVYLSHREADARDRLILARYRELFFYQTDLAGVPSDVMRKMVSFPALSLDFEMTHLFLSTPGKQAGTPL